MGKILRLSLISLSQGQRELSYTQIKEALEIADNDAVEEVVIDTVAAGNLDAKLDQDAEVVHIRRVDQRTFANDADSWGKLNTQLSLWSQNISSVLDHMAQNTHVEG